MFLPQEIRLSMETFIQTISYGQLYLPPEIISKIYSFWLQEHCYKIIGNHCYNYIKVKNTLVMVIMTCINVRTFHTPTNHIFDSIYVEALQNLLNWHIPRKYSLTLIANFLQILSSNIHYIRFAQRVSNISNKSELGKQLIIVLDLWLQLCKKFNFKLYLYKNENDRRYIYARNIIKMNKYDQNNIAPAIVAPFTNYILHGANAREYLLNYLRESIR